jgi:hypothetical protein
MRGLFAFLLASLLALSPAYGEAPSQALTSRVVKRGAPLNAKTYCDFVQQTCRLLGTGWVPTSVVLAGWSNSISGTGNNGLLYGLNNNNVWVGFSANTPRLTDRGLRFESQAINSVIHSRDLTNPSWAKTTMSTALTGTGFDNTTNSATKITASGAGATAIDTAESLGSANQTLSVFVKCNTVTNGGITCVLAGTISLTQDNGSTYTALSSSNCFDTQTGSAVTPAIGIDFRCYVKQTLANPQVGIKLSNNLDSIVVDNFQGEATIIPTSPIVTTTAAVTRGGDTENLTTGIVWGLINNQVPLGAYAEVVETYYPNNPIGTIISFNDGSAANNIRMSINASGQPAIFSQNTSVTACNTSGAAGASVPVHKVAFTYNPAYCVAALDNTKAAVATNAGAAPTYSRFQLGRDFSGNAFFGEYRKLAIWAGAPRWLIAADMWRLSHP